MTPSTGPAPRRALRTLAALAATALTVGLGGCGASAGTGPPTLSWYVNPDAGGQAEIAKRCTADSGGRYRIAISTLPNAAADQRLQLVRRLAASDTSIDIMSLDPPFIPELSDAKFLAPVPQDVQARVTEGVIDSAVTGATWRGDLVTVPFWANTQLLWYKKSVARAAGLDMSRPVTWDQLITAAQQQDQQIAVQGTLAESMTVWINALIASAGGQIITDPSAKKPEDLRFGLTSEAGKQAAAIMEKIGRSGVGGPGLSTADETANANSFESGAAAFMVNWPFVWPKATGEVESGLLKRSVTDDYGWALYPRVDANTPSKPPLGGINLGVSAFSEHADLAYAATECITSVKNEAYYFVTNGNPASKEAAYDDPEVVKSFPMAPAIRDSLKQAAARPQTAYYNEVSQSLQRDYHPPASVRPGTTGKQATELITNVLANKELL